MPDMLHVLHNLIEDRKTNPRPGSYTNSLLDEGLPRIAQKVGEEAVEVVVAALSQNRDSQIAELADLFYHTLVLMSTLDISLEDINIELKQRHQ